MPARNEKSLAKYVDQLAAIMGLGGWNIVIHVDGMAPDQGDNACVWCYDDVMAAHIHFDPDWVDWDAAHLREVVTHELNHIHLDHMSVFIFDTIKASGHPKAARRLIRKTFVHDLERANDCIARAWAELLPLPPFSTPTGD